MTKIRTIKVGQDAITGGSKPHYALVSDRKVIAIGSKEEMLELNQEIDGRVWLTNAKVDEVVEARIPQTEDGPCWDTHKQVGMKKKGNRLVPNCVPKEEAELNEWGEVEEAAEYKGRKVTLNKPTKGDIKKSKVYVKNEKGNVVKVEFGDPNMQIQKDIPARRKSFRARHNCDNPGPKWKARYWSCKAW